MTVRQLVHPAIVMRRAKEPSALLDSAEIILFTIALGMLMFAAGNWARGSMSERPEPVVTAITIQAGDTLWSIAREYGDPDEYILERVSALARANNLENGRALREGQVIVIPVSSRSAKMYRGGKICREPSQSGF